MDPESPPRKKMKQARLPFQVLTPKKTTIELSGGSKKRKLSAGSDDDPQVVKVIKSVEVEEAKENKTTDIPFKSKEPKVKTVTDTEGQKDSLEENPEKGITIHLPESDESLISATKNQMKLKLSSLLSRKHSTPIVTAKEDQDAEIDSAEEITEETNLELDSGGKRKRSAKSPNVTTSATKKSKRKSMAKKGNRKKTVERNELESVHQSDVIVSVPEEEDSIKLLEKRDKVMKGETLSESKEITEIVGLEKSHTEEKKVEKKHLLPKKTRDMFAAWRKTPNGTPANQAPCDKKVEVASPEKAVEAKETVNECSNESNDKSENPKHDNMTQENLPALTEPSEPKEEKEDAKMKNLSEDRSEEVAMVPSEKMPSEEIVLISEEESSENHSSEMKETKDRMEGLSTPKSLSKTPQRRLTPKQAQKLLDSAKRLEEKEKLKQEKEREKQRLKLEKEEQKKKEKEEKEEQKKKEKEEKEELKRKEKEEKERKKQAEIEQKNEEKRKKDEQKEEKRRKEEEKKKMEEEEERKKAKASAMFTSFFVPKSSKTEEVICTPTPTVQNFMPFEVKADMRMAPSVRLTLSSQQKEYLEKIVNSNSRLPLSELYVESVRSGKVPPHSSGRTWNLEENREDDVSILEPDDTGMFVIQPKKIEKLRAKLLQFCENHRPPYCGTWRKKSSAVTGRTPFKQDKILDYEVDSADEWEEEEPGESLHGSDDEKEQESEDEYEVDNSVFVPHGYLSEDEGDDEVENEVLSPETQKAKLKLLGEEFEAQMKSKTSALKPVIIVLTAAMQANALGSARYQKLLERRAVWREDEGPIELSPLGPDGEIIDGHSVRQTDPSQQSVSTGPGARKKLISEEAIPALITLLHGNRNKRVFLAKEFSAFLGKYKDASTPVQENIGAEDAAVLESPSTPASRSTPSINSTTPASNRMLSKWTYLPPASKASISSKIQELASWRPCPDEGPMFTRQCWYVPQEFRDQYGLSDLRIPNSEWDYILEPKRGSNEVNVNSPSRGSAVSNNITKFTKILTPEEKQREWNMLNNKNSSSPALAKSTSKKPCTGKITSFTCSLKAVSEDTKSSPKTDLFSSHSAPSPSPAAGPASKTPSTTKPQTKKRVPLLVSVPRGQQIKSAHCSLLPKFEASANTSLAVSDTTCEKNPSQNTIKCVTLD